jgi:hypothetical protein
MTDTLEEKKDLSSFLPTQIPPLSNSLMLSQVPISVDGVNSSSSNVPSGNAASVSMLPVQLPSMQFNYPFGMPLSGSFPSVMSYPMMQQQNMMQVKQPDFKYTPGQLIDEDDLIEFDEDVVIEPGKEEEYAEARRKRRDEVPMEVNKFYNMDSVMTNAILRSAYFKEQLLYVFNCF